MAQPYNRQDFRDEFQRRQDEALERSFAGVSDRVLRRIMADINGLPERTPKLTFKTISSIQRENVVCHYGYLAERIALMGNTSATFEHAFLRKRLSNAKHQLWAYICGTAPYMTTSGVPMTWREMMSDDE